MSEKNRDVCRDDATESVELGLPAHLSEEGEGVATIRALSLTLKWR